MNWQSLAQEVMQFAQAGTDFIYVLATMIGIVFALMAARDIVRKGDQHHSGPQVTWGGISGRLLVASFMVTLAHNLSEIMAVNGSMSGPRSALAYAQGASSDPTSQAIWAAISAWCVLMGTAGFFRGFLLLDKASQGGHESGADVWRATWHILGGAIVVAIFK